MKLLCVKSRSLAGATAEGGPDDLDSRGGFGDLEDARDAHFSPIFGLSLCTEFQLANMREWVELFDKPRPSGIEVPPFSRFGIAGLVPARKIYVHCEVDVLHSMQHSALL